MASVQKTCSLHTYINNCSYILCYFIRKILLHKIDNNIFELLVNFLPFTNFLGYLQLLQLLTNDMSYFLSNSQTINHKFLLRLSKQVNLLVFAKKIPFIKCSKRAKILKAYLSKYIYRVIQKRLSNFEMR